MSDLFDTTNTDDLPEKLREIINKSIKENQYKMKHSAQFFIDIFKKKSPISPIEIMIAMYRLHKKEMSRAYVHNILTHLRKSNLVRPTNIRGKYELIETEDGDVK